MWVKICANTNLEDASLAAELGADAVGFVFAPSSRQVTPSQVAKITRNLPDTLETVGVFPNWNANRIAEAAEEAGISAIQLHGGPDLELARKLHARFRGTIDIIAVLHWQVEANRTQTADLLAEALELAQSPIICRLLIDSKIGTTSGGTGVTLDWNAARPLFAAYTGSILAGGLNPENVREAIRQLNPWGVDVASGVEAYPGKKDPAKMAAFLQAARALQLSPQTSDA